MKHKDQGPMENLLDGLDESSDALSAEELRKELAARGIDVDAAIAKVEEKIAKHLGAEAPASQEYNEKISCGHETAAAQRKKQSK